MYVTCFVLYYHPTTWAAICRLQRISSQVKQCIKQMVSGCPNWWVLSLFIDFSSVCTTGIVMGPMTSLVDAPLPWKTCWGLQHKRLDASCQCLVLICISVWTVFLVLVWVHNDARLHFDWFTRGSLWCVYLYNHFNFLILILSRVNKNNSNITFFLDFFSLQWSETEECFFIFFISEYLLSASSQDEPKACHSGSYSAVVSVSAL